MRKLCVVLLLAIVVFSGCGSDPVYAIWGKPSESKGLAKHGFNEETAVLTILYRYTQWSDSSVYHEELGSVIGNKPHRTFEKIKEVDAITVIGYAPLLVDSLGNSEWVPRVAFTLTRELNDRINWDDFDPSNLFDVCGGELLR